MNLAQNSDYMIVSNNEAASIINRFTPEMIEDLVEDALENRSSGNTMNLTNIVQSLETNFKVYCNGLPDYVNELKSTRYNTYMNIINQLSKAHNLLYIGGESLDIYSSAFYIYDLLVSRFNELIVKFFSNYINKEKSMIYETLELGAKRKDSSMYSKKIFKNSNSKLAVIHANLEYVLQNVCAYDIDFPQYLDIAYTPQKVISNFLQSVLQDEGDFFRRIIIPHFNENYAFFTTFIKFELQGFATAEFNDIV